MTRKGFTLMELLIVIAIIGLIAAIAAPRMEGTISDARGALFQAHIGAIATAVEQFRAAHRGWLEVMTNVPGTEKLTVNALKDNHYIQEEAFNYKEDDGGLGTFNVRVIDSDPITRLGITIDLDDAKKPNLINKTFYIVARPDGTAGNKIVYVDDEEGITITGTLSDWEEMKAY